MAAHCPRIVGTIKKWQNLKEKKVRMSWYDGEQTNELETMADADFDLRLEKYADGRDPPRSRGDGARGVQPAAQQPQHMVLSSLPSGSGFRGTQLRLGMLSQSSVCLLGWESDTPVLVCLYWKQVVGNLIGNLASIRSSC